MYRLCLLFALVDSVSTASVHMSTAANNPLFLHVLAGKTIGVAQLSTALLFSVPDIRIACFAPTLRQAVTLLTSIQSIMARHPNYSKFKVMNQSQVSITIRGPDGTERKITAYPSSHKVCAWVFFFVFL